MELNMTKNKIPQRQYHLDYLRVLASVAIILLHVTAQNMDYVGLAGTEWNIYNICNSASRWGVPVFCNDERCALYSAGNPH